MPYIPHTEEDVKTMLSSMSLSDVDSLFDEIPSELRCKDFQSIPDSSNEMQMLQHAAALASQNNNGICFLGAGAYEHHIPAAVWDIATRGEYLTAYTPYQAEASQGTLQLLYEYQTMMAELTAMEVSNASLYDGASALAEAVLMAARLQKNIESHRVLVPASLHPLYRETLDTILRNQHIELITLPFDDKTGVTSLGALKQYEHQTITALVIPQPNFFGCLEPVDELSDWAKAHNIISIGCVNPMSLALLKPPGEWGSYGVDIACGEGQPLGVPLASGGPYFGFLTTKMAHVRQMPGRLIGQTVDAAGKRGFALTLQAREQHIRRAKATSNICTNQGLLVTAATIYMSLLGPAGLASVAKACWANTQKLVQALTSIDGVTLAFESANFHECVLTLIKPVPFVLEALSKRGITGGYALTADYPNIKNGLLVCATELRTGAEIDAYRDALAQILHEGVPS